MSCPYGQLAAIAWVAMLLVAPARGQAQSSPASQPAMRTVKLSQLHWRDQCILPDPVSKTYYMVGPGGRSVRAYTSKDLINWTGPKTIYRAPNDVRGDIPIVSIWAPEMHYYKGKYYLFLTFDTRHKLAEQWRHWLPQSEPLFAPGGHPMLFQTFEGKIMMVLHSPNNMNSQPHIFEMEDTGDTLKLVKEFRDTNP